VIDLPNLLAVAQIPAPEPEQLYTNEAFAIAGVTAIVVLVVCFLKPAIGKFVGKLAAIAFMGLGVGGLVWGILASARGDQTPESGPLAGASFNLIIGGGAGFLAAGIVALVLACLIRLPVPIQDHRPGSV
jgi:hypothetical protein